MKPNKVGISFWNVYASVLCGSLRLGFRILGSGVYGLGFWC